jgi:hypothetical protein
MTMSRRTASRCRVQIASGLPVARGLGGRVPLDRAGVGVHEDLQHPPFAFRQPGQPVREGRLPSAGARTASRWRCPAKTPGDGDGIVPAAPQAGQQDPEQPVGPPQARARRGTLEDGQLVPQREVLEHEGALGPDLAEEADEDEGDHAGHHRSGRPTVQC